MRIMKIMRIFRVEIEKRRRRNFMCLFLFLCCCFIVFFVGSKSKRKFSLVRIFLYLLLGINFEFCVGCGVCFLDIVWGKR